MTASPVDPLSSPEVSTSFDTLLDRHFALSVRHAAASQRGDTTEVERLGLLLDQTDAEVGAEGRAMWREAKRWVAHCAAQPDPSA